ncbi:hypothetical protein SSP531S_17180 [Streptomyces spongiicola]|uniref:Uncharacterized protein n=1 Tax=Streptomyces spongiicola TaxID=1690221 RepID=A0A388SW92_9ACTN|nr:hypothetical protein SSP531S_17180 [Streptomyces spongiicola]
MCAPEPEPAPTPEPEPAPTPEPEPAPTPVPVCVSASVRHARPVRARSEPAYGAPLPDPKGRQIPAARARSRLTAARTSAARARAAGSPFGPATGTTTSR